MQDSVWWVDGWMDTVVSFLTRNGAEQSHHPLRESIQSAKCPKRLIALVLRTRAIPLLVLVAVLLSSLFSSPAHCIRGVAVPRGWTEIDRWRKQGTDYMYRTVRVRSTTAVYRVRWPWLLCLRASSMAALDWLAMARGRVRIEGIAKFGK